VLAAISLPILGGFKERSYRAAGLSNLRQIGVATLLYCGDNDQRLPGPLYMGQGPLYQTGIETLASYLQNYISLKQNLSGTYWEAKIFGSPAYYAKRLSTNDNAYVLNTSVKLESGATTNPWGYPGISRPVKITALSSPSGIWMIRDVDLTYFTSNNIPRPAWSCPKSPIYGKYRISLNFDGRVETVSSVGIPPANAALP